MAVGGCGEILPPVLPSSPTFGHNTGTDNPDDGWFGRLSFCPQSEEVVSMTLEQDDQAARG